MLSHIGQWTIATICCGLSPPIPSYHTRPFLRSCSHGITILLSDIACWEGINWSFTFVCGDSKPSHLLARIVLAYQAHNQNNYPQDLENDPGLHILLGSTIVSARWPEETLDSLLQATWLLVLVSELKLKRQTNLPSLRFYIIIVCPMYVAVMSRSATDY